jgi:hypothetical protein
VKRTEEYPVMSSGTLPEGMEKDHRPWVTNLEDCKKNMMGGIGGLIAGLVLIVLFLIVPSDLRIIFLILGVVMTFVGAILALAYNSGIQSIKRTGIKLNREVSRIRIKQNLNGTLKNTSEFLEYPIVEMYFRLLVPKDMIAVKKIIEKLLTEKEVTYRAVEVKLEAGAAPASIPLCRELYKFVLPEHIEIAIGRREVGGSENHAVTLYVSIFPVTPENELVVEDWRQRIEEKLKDFVSTKAQ